MLRMSYPCIENVSRIHVQYKTAQYIKTTVSKKKILKVKIN